MSERPDRNPSTPAPDPVADPSALDDAILIAQVEQLYHGQRTVLWLSTLIAALFIAVYWRITPAPLLATWAGLFAAITVARWLLIRAFARNGTAASDARRWYRRILLLTFGAGLVWGSAPWLLVVDDSPGELALMAVALGGIATGSVVSHGARWPVAWVLLIPVLGAFALRFAVLDVPQSPAIASFLVFFLLAMLMFARQHSERLTRAIALGIRESATREAAEREQERYRTLLESSRAIVWEYDPVQRRFLYVSPQAEAVLGYPRERWLQETDFWPAQMHAEDRAWVPDTCMRQIEAHRDHAFDYRMFSADGREVWLHDAVRVIPNPDGYPRVIGVMFDITEHKQVQLELEYVSGLMMLMLDTAQHLLHDDTRQFDPILNRMLAQVGRLCKVDRAYLIVFDEDLATFTNTHEWVADGVSAEIDNLQQLPTTTIPRMLEHLRRGDELVIDEVQALPEDWSSERSILQAQSIQSLLLFPIMLDGRLDGLVGFDAVRQPRRWRQLEIDALRMLANFIGSALKHHTMARRLRESEALRSEAEALARMGSWDWDVGAERFEPSPEWRRVMGFADDEPLTPEKVSNCIHEDDRGRVLAAFNQAIEHTGELELEHRIRRADDGRERWLRVQARIVEVDGHRRMRGFAQDITETKQAEEQLYKLGHYDALTGLPNRRLARDRLEHALMRAQRSRDTLGVLFIDLDRFKKINDSLGHEAGDRALIDAARRLERLVGSADTVARIGGDEFLVLAEQFSGPEELLVLANRIRSAFREPVEVDGRARVDRQHRHCRRAGRWQPRRQADASCRHGDVPR